MNGRTIPNHNEFIRYKMKQVLEKGHALDTIDDSRSYHRIEVSSRADAGNYR